VSVNQKQTREERARALSGLGPLGRRAQRRAKAEPPKAGALTASFPALAAMSGMSVSWIDKQARLGKFESFKTSPNSRLGVVSSFVAMLEDFRSQGPRFNEAPPVREGRRPRGRPRKEDVSPESN
jgi:hypothetical protein